MPGPTCKRQCPPVQPAGRFTGDTMIKSSLRNNSFARVALSATFVACVIGANHGAIAADLAQLDKLTPTGAEKEGNKDGTIPAWQGAEAPLPGWEWGKSRRAYWKHKDEKPLFTIDKSI